ncbi:MAG TPA: alpha-amylase family protein [Bryobacteraceae bacterium]|nr:alpha-amylase family protein [Bryobacteraceae bacterium]
MPITRRAFTATLVLPSLLRPQAPKPRKKRSDSFFGLHFDLHPGPEDPALGRDVSAAMVEKLLAAARPDFVQYDSKGHVGWLAWPDSKVGPSAPHIVNDSLAVWRKATEREGVALYIHFSGVWDSQAVARHPGWARLDPAGKPDANITSTFGPYVDELMIPELREAAARYALDGAWVDGECWAVKPDYSPRALEAWKKETGFDQAPRQAGEPHWLEWLEFQRAQFRRYVRHYIDALHESHPGFQVASNWMYSTLAPEQPELPVDFLSGDYLGNAPISSARLDARYLGATGKPWDLMAWGFVSAPGATGHVHKSAVQLQQEASVVVAQGGGFQIYYTPSREGHIEDSNIAVMGKVGAFCRERQAFSHRSETVPQIGVVFSKESLYTTENKLFGGWGSATGPAAGWLDALLDSQYSADVLPDWKFDAAAAAYSFVVLPDWPATGETALAAVKRYVEQGGTALVAGAQNAAWWLAQEGKPAEQPAFVGGGEVLASMGGVWLDVTPSAGMRVLEKRYRTMDTTLEGQPAAIELKLGRGTAVLAPGPVGALYAASHAPAVRDFVRRLVRGRFAPLVEVEAPPSVEVVLRRKNGKLYVHLLNLTAMQVAGEYKAIDFVPEVGPVRVRFPQGAPHSVRLLPGGGELRAPYTVDRLHLHAALEVS